MRIIVLIHGIHTRRRKARRWYKPLGTLLRQRMPSVQVEHFFYGWTAGLSIRLPLIGLMVRKRLIRKFQKFVRKLVKRHGPGVEVDVVAHSFGTWITHHSMTKGKWHTFYRRLVYMAGVVSSRENFKGEKGHYEHILNLHSRGDDVIRLVPFGHSGYRGFVNWEGNNVVNGDLTPANHNDYTEPGAAWSRTARFLALEGIAEVVDA